MAVKCFTLKNQLSLTIFLTNGINPLEGGASFSSLHQGVIWPGVTLYPSQINHKMCCSIFQTMGCDP